MISANSCEAWLRKHTIDDSFDFGVNGRAYCSFTVLSGYFVGVCRN